MGRNSAIREPLATFLQSREILAARAHGARELEHRAAAEDPVDLADVAALVQALLPGRRAASLHV